MKLLEGILDPAIRIETGDPRADWATVMPGEEVALLGAVPKRRREFLAGRSLARDAMRKLGMCAVAIPVAQDRTPVWPEGVAGSISHCDDLCAVAVGRTTDGFISIGLDLEPAEALDDDIVAEICNTDEREWLASQPEAERGLFARIIFSAKECAYKCQYPLSRRLLDFQAMTIRIDRDDGDFVAQFNIDAEPFQTGDRLSGRFVVAADHIATGMALKREQPSDMRRNEWGKGDGAVARNG